MAVVRTLLFVAGLLPAIVLAQGLTLPAGGETPRLNAVADPGADDAAGAAGKALR